MGLRHQLIWMQKLKNKKNKKKYKKLKVKMKIVTVMLKILVCSSSLLKSMNSKNSLKIAKS